MRIAIISNWFSESMGYIENALPKALAALGHDVHVITSTGQVYYNSVGFEQTYGRYLGERFVESGQRHLNGFELYRQPPIQFRGRLGIRDLGKSLSKIDPDVVQILDHASLSALQTAFWHVGKTTPLFSASHVHASVFPPANNPLSYTARLKILLFSWLPGRFVSGRSKKCYVISKDASDVAVEFLGVQPKKAEISPLGVDTDLFNQPMDEGALARRTDLRAKLGSDTDDIVCIYTGRLSAGKGALVLASAVKTLSDIDKRFKAVFVGAGEQADEIRALGMTVIDFVPHQDLADYYRACDIGVWPKQESTSMLDASACGLPIIVSDRITTTERVEGVGLTYREGEVDSLVGALRTLGDGSLRRRLGALGAERVRHTISWAALATKKASDYENAINTTV